MSPKLRNIFLDLDETLISAIEMDDLKHDQQLLENFNKRSRLFKFYLMDKDYIITERPGVQDFLDFVFKHFNVSVWTAASKDYALFVIDKVVLRKPERKLNYILYSEHCDQSKSCSGCIKQLNQIFHLDGYNHLNTAIIDDNRNVHDKQTNTVIAVKPFAFFGTNSEVDDQLARIRKRLIQLGQVPKSPERPVKQPVSTSNSFAGSGSRASKSPKKPATKPTTKPATKPTAKPAAKPTTKPAAKPVDPTPPSVSKRKVDEVSKHHTKKSKI